MFQSSEKREIYYKTDGEIELIRESCLLVSKTLAYVATLIQPGVTSKFIDTKAEEFIRDNALYQPSKVIETFPLRYVFP